MALSQRSSSRMIYDRMLPLNGATIEPRIRFNQPDDENTRCKGSRALGPRKDFSPCMQQSTTPSTSNVISPLQEPTEPFAGRDEHVARGSRGRLKIYATQVFRVLHSLM